MAAWALLSPEGMKPIELKQRMLADHRRLESLFTRVMDAFDANAREDTQALWTELEYGLERHFRAEEKYLFPKFSQLDATETAGLQAEHALLRRQLQDLGVGVDLKLVKADVAKGFIDMLRAHASREDAVLYRWADESLGGDAKPLVDALLR